MNSTVYDNNLGVGGKSSEGPGLKAIGSNSSGLLLRAGNAVRENEFAVTPTEHLPPSVRRSIGAACLMHLDVQTLSVVTVFVTALLGALLVFAGLQNRSIRAPMWWGAAHIINAVGLGFLTSRGAAPSFRHRSTSPTRLILLGYGLTWTGARVFDGRSIRPWSGAAGAGGLDAALRHSRL